MESMFSFCQNLEIINLGNINTSSVKTMKTLFGNCYKLTSINLSNFDFSRVTDISYMFSGCNNIEKNKFLKYKYIIT